MVRPEEMDGMAREARHLPQPQQQRGQQGSGRGAAILNAEVNGVGEMSFLRFVNRDRVRLDALGDAFFLVVSTLGVIKWGRLLPAGAQLAYMVQLALCTLRLWMSRRHPSTYITWREVPAAIHTLLLVASPLLQHMTLLVARALGDMGPQNHPPDSWNLRSLSVTLGILFISRLHCAVAGVAYRLRAPLHMVLHAVLLTWQVPPQAAPLCQLLVPGDGGDGDCGGELSGWHAFFSYFLVALPPPLPLQLFLGCDAAARCRCVIITLRSLLAFLLPTALNLWWERREFRRFLLTGTRAAAVPPLGVMMNLKSTGVASTTGWQLLHEGSKMFINSEGQRTRGALVHVFVFLVRTRSSDDKSNIDGRPRVERQLAGPDLPPRTPTPARQTANTRTNTRKQ